MGCLPHLAQRTLASGSPPTGSPTLSRISPTASWPPRRSTLSQPGSRLVTDSLADQIVTATPDAVIVADPEGVIQLWNGGAEAIFGYSETEAIGQTLDLIVPERFRDRHWEGYRRVMSTGETRY